MDVLAERGSKAEPVEVTLEWYEHTLALVVGKLRHESAQKRGSANKYGDGAETPEEALQKHVNGAAAELAVAKAINRYWSGSVDTYNEGADVGETVQVRWRSRRNYQLIVREHDKDDHYYFLVRGASPAFSVVGFIRGADAKQQRWKKTHGGYKPAYFVPDSALRGVQ